jgi:hypothetical protein
VALAMASGLACATRAATPSEPGKLAPMAPRPQRPALAAMDMPPTPLTFELDDRVWHEKPTGSSSNPEVVGARMFFRDSASPSAQCPPDMVVIAQRVPDNLDIVDFSASKRVGMPPVVIDGMFSFHDGSIRLGNAIGYRMRGSFGCEPVAFMVHAIERGYGFSIIIEIDPHDFAIIEKEILAILRSFRAS